MTTNVQLEKSKWADALICPIRPEIIASWNRCKEMKVDRDGGRGHIISEPELRDCLEQKRNSWRSPVRLWRVFLKLLKKLAIVLS